MTSLPPVAIITGGADGLGFAIAERLVRKGARVALFDFNEEALQKAQRKLGEPTFVAKVDVADRTAVGLSVEAVAEAFGRIDILINCAGITGRTNIKSHEVDLEDFNRVMRVNVNGCLNTFQAVAPHMLRQEYGRVLHFASISGKEGNAGMLAYSTSKAAVIGMTKVQGKEYAGTGLTVNAIAPGYIDTDMVAAVPANVLEKIVAKIPVGRLGKPEEVAGLIIYLASDEAAFLTGANIAINGGQHMQ
jgi:3-oxoacyl-[acyl-carrier protein] reductase